MISIIIPVYNTEKYLKRCIKSLINQTYKNLEFIFIDDGSTDSSLSILKKYEKKDNRIKVYHQENNGVSSARNYGLQVAKGDYIGFVDSDDYIENNMFEQLYLNIIKFDADMVICDMNAYSINGKVKQIRYNNNNLLDIKKEFITKSTNGYMCNKLYKNSIIKKYNLKFDINISFMEDFVFNLNYIDKSKNIRYINKQLYNYVNHSNSAIYSSHKIISSINLYKNVLYFKKKWNIQDRKQNIELKIINMIFYRMRCLISKNDFEKVDNILNSKKCEDIVSNIRWNNVKLNRYFIIKLIWKKHKLMYIYMKIMNILALIKHICFNLGIWFNGGLFIK